MSILVKQGLWGLGAMGSMVAILWTIGIVTHPLMLALGIPPEAPAMEVPVLAGFGVVLVLILVVCLAVIFGGAIQAVLESEQPKKN